MAYYHTPTPIIYKNGENGEFVIYCIFRLVLHIYI